MLRLLHLPVSIKLDVETLQMDVKRMWGRIADLARAIDELREAIAVIDSTLRQRGQP